MFAGVPNHRNALPTQSRSIPFAAILGTFNMLKSTDSYIPNTITSFELDKIKVT